MHSILPLILVTALVGSFALDAAADLLNIRIFPASVPPELAGIYTEPLRERAERYLRETTGFSLLDRFVSLVTLLGFWLLGGFRLIDGWSRAAGLGAIPTGLLFAGLLTVLQATLDMPFSAYSTFIIERNYGFNRTTTRTFLLDLLRGTLLVLLLGGAAFAPILYFFGHYGPGAWLPAWLALGGVQLIVTFLAPAVIFPLFNRFESLPEGPLRRKIAGYLDAQGLRVQGVYVMDGSRRSSKANAFFAGFGRLRKVVLFDTLIEKHTPAEIVAVLAHEVGHLRRGHILGQMAVSLVLSAVLFWVASLLLDSVALARAFGLEGPSVHANLIFISILAGPALRGFAIGGEALSRRHEVQADAFAAQTTGDPAALASALLRLGTDHLSHPAPHRLKVLTTYSHPPLSERIRRLKAFPAGAGPR